MTRNDGQSPEEIEEEAEQSREQLASTLGELRDRLTPGQIFDEVFEGSSENATRFLRNLGTSVRDNPLPAVLVGAGLAMMMTGMTGRSLYGAGRKATSFASHRSGGGDGAADESSETLTSGIGRRLNSAADSIGFALSDTGEALGRMTNNASAAMSSAGERLASSGQSIGHGARGLGETIAEQPLIAAALGLAVGAIFGAAMPTSEVENRLMGEPSRSVKKSASDFAAEQMENVKEAAQAVAEDVRSEASSQGLGPEGARSAAESVSRKIGAVTDRAMESVRRQAHDKLMSGDKPAVE
jgi:ElaB/YqjD/DUF883 family membrane-anchored ribosome-binding protein